MTTEAKPFCMTMYSNCAWGYQCYCTLMDTHGMKYSLTNTCSYMRKSADVFELRRIEKEPVSQWWSEFKEYVTSKNIGQQCDQVEELKTLAAKITVKPKLEMFGTGMRDGGGISCYLFVGNDMWMLEEHGCGATKNIYPEINEFVSKVYEVLKSDVHPDLYRHHTRLNCKYNHPLVIATQKELDPHPESEYGSHEYKDGYICDTCGVSEKTAESYHCYQCCYDLCPACAKKELDNLVH